MLLDIGFFHLVGEQRRHAVYVHARAVAEDLLDLAAELLLERKNRNAHGAGPLALAAARAAPGQMLGVDELEEELSAVERVIEAQRKAGCYDVERICAVLAE